MTLRVKWGTQDSIHPIWQQMQTKAEPLARPILYVATQTKPFCPVPPSWYVGLQTLQKELRDGSFYLFSVSLVLCSDLEVYGNEPPRRQVTMQSSEVSWMADDQNLRGLLTWVVKCTGLLSLYSLK